MPIGNRNTGPGPVIRLNLPSRNTTARSQLDNTRNVLETNSAANSPTTNIVIHSIVAPPSRHHGPEARFPGVFRNCSRLSSKLYEIFLRPGVISSFRGIFGRTPDIAPRAV